mmetsp:Transcript_71916/g.164920  ORF Transcript_71916/g.164920 Transcript_71916/m.164920 type:complete len:508 (+) Transcript_71916:29-1552(+)|eukprot:CAMPEP_0204391778 /NCGR_PEP_ID=MMETSP0469-20131031/61421_1 /ASSEMBLY_ACC=CAM_ASM_000384 /TAXON_ID=2969 /ORGANISM="Oxyrrhis marina" /LENGTH=507 /DNA_ID=CAMNT_0051385739 /DNA_START=29 /DNA_END=1552 /DNA_ORIENTATION=+
MSHMFEEMSGSQPVCHVVPVFGADQFPLKAGWVNTRRRRKSKRPHRLAKRQRQAVASLPEKVYPVEYAKVELRGFKVLKALFPNAGSDRIVSGLREAALLPYPERVARMCAKLSEESVVGGGLSRSRTEPSPAPLKVSAEVPNPTRVSKPVSDLARGWDRSASAEMEYWVDHQECVFGVRETSRHAERRSERRSYVHDWRALRFPVPPNAVLNAVSIARSLAGLDEDQEEVASEELSRPTSFAEVQRRFLQKHSSQLTQELGDGAKFEIALLNRTVQERFLSQLLKFQYSEPVLGFHGTAKKNIGSILAQGLRIPGNGNVRVAHGSVHGVGIYTAKQGSSCLSRSFCDSDQMLVCGVIDNGPTLQDNRRQSRSRPTHKPSRKPTSVKSPVILGRQVLHRDGVVRHVGSAMVVFDESRVAPLLVARGVSRPGRVMQPSYQQLPTRNTNNVQDSSLGRCQFRIAGERVFESWQPGQFHRSEKTVKRRIVAKHRYLRLVADRAEKGGATH